MACGCIVEDHCLACGKAVYEDEWDVFGIYSEAVILHEDCTRLNRKSRRRLKRLARRRYRKVGKSAQNIRNAQ